MRHRAYLDHNATTPLHPSAREAMVAAFEAYGNPSSVHAEGRAARAIVDQARRDLAGMVGCASEDVVFTSCGTEALNIALSPAFGGGCDVLLMGGGEHPAVGFGHRFGARVETLPMGADGALDLAELAVALGRQGGRRVMLALQAANNETGVLQPVREAADMVHAHGGVVICDAVQAAGKVSCDLETFGADALAVSAHKFGGPKGVGALCFGASRHHLNDGVVRGGGHERGLSAGTENVVGIAGLGAACRAAVARMGGDDGRTTLLRDAIQGHVVAACPDALVFGGAASRLPNTVCFAAPGYDAQVLMMNLDLGGVSVSAGSACASGTIRPSHVLKAMGVADGLTANALRVSVGWTTGEKDVELFARALAAALKVMAPEAGVSRTRAPRIAA